MSDTIPVERFTSELVTLLDETFENVHGMYLDRGTSLFETLATITAEEASRPVSPTCATLAAQVEHVRFYLDVLEGAIKGDGSGDNADWGYIWRTVREVTPVQWADSQGRLMESYQRVMRLLKTLTWKNGDEVGGAMAIVAHTAYHLGEIRMALCTLHEKPKSGAQVAYGSTK